jgi:hypothetical protein
MELANVTKTVQAPIDGLWALLSDFGRPDVLTPTITACSMTGTGIGAIRRVTTSRGLTIHERLLACDETAHRLQYEVLDSASMPLPAITSYCATVRLWAVATWQTRVSWRAEGEVAHALEPVTAYLSSLYYRAIDNLAASAAPRPPAVP